MQIEPSVRLPERYRLRLPAGLVRAIKIAAAKRHTSPVEYVRQALLRALQEDGVPLIADAGG